jgi:nucleoside-diphosphate-sugar epimerase
MKVLITGGTGFIGSRLALRCLERGDSVRILGQENTSAEVNNRKLIEASGAQVVLAPVAERDQVFEAARDVDVVYHLAAAQHEANVPDQHFWDVNVTGTRNVLDASLDAGVGRFVHGSTIGIYGSALAGTLDEQSPPAPDNIYGVTKLEGERLALSYLDRLPVVVIRISETYGPGDWRLLKLFRAIKKRTFFMIGDGKNLHHPIYIDDLIQGFHLAASKEKAVGRTFVLPGKEPVTTREMVAAIAEQLGTTIRGFHAPLLPFQIAAVTAEKTLGSVGIQPPIHPRRMDFFRKSYVLSSEQATSTLGFEPKSSFEDGVRDTARWYTEMGYL